MSKIPNSVLPEKFCSPFVKGQVIALDIGEDGDKFNTKDLEGDYSCNRFWVILNVAEMNNTCDARIICMALNSLSKKTDTYKIKENGQVKVIPTENLTYQVVYAQPDRVVFNSFGSLVMIRTTQIKSFSIKDVVLSNYRHVYFLPREVVEVLDNILKSTFGLSEKTQQISNYGSVNRMGYEAHYTHSASNIPILEAAPTPTGKKDVTKKKKHQKHEDKRIMKPTPPAPVQQKAEKVEPANTSSLGKKLNELTSSILLEKYMVLSNEIPVASLVGRFNGLLNETNEILSKNGISPLLVKINDKDVVEAAEKLHLLVKRKKKKKLSVMIKADSLALFNALILSEAYQNRLKQKQNLINSTTKLVEEKKPISKVEKPTVDEDAIISHSETVNSLRNKLKRTALAAHMGRKKAKWTFHEANIFIDNYIQAKLSYGSVDEYDCLFHFDVNNQYGYLTKRFRFREIPNILNLKVCDNPFKLEVKHDNVDIVNQFVNDCRSGLSEKIMIPKYGITNDECLEYKKILWNHMHTII